MNEKYLHPEHAHSFGIYLIYGRFRIVEPWGNVCVLAASLVIFIIALRFIVSGMTWRLSFVAMFVVVMLIGGLFELFSLHGLVEFERFWYNWFTTEKRPPSAFRASPLLKHENP